MSCAKGAEGKGAVDVGAWRVISGSHPPSGRLAYQHQSSENTSGSANQSMLSSERGDDVFLLARATVIAKNTCLPGAMLLLPSALSD